MSIMKNILLTVYALATTIVGCGVEYIDVPVDVAFDTRFYYAPDATIQWHTEEAAKSLSDATGLPFQIASFGVPVLAVPPGTLINDDKAESCAWTKVSHYGDKIVEVRIEVEVPPRPECMYDLRRTIEHEMIHSIRRVEDLSALNGGHTATGVFQAYANNNDNKLNDESLAAVCEAVPCREFNPED